MLPKYLPPEDQEKFFTSVKTAGEKLSIKDSFRFVHDMIGYFEEKEGLEPLAALDKTHKVICQPR